MRQEREMLDALMNFALLDVAFMVIAAVVAVYALVRVSARGKTASAQLDAHLPEQLAATHRDRAEMDIHSRV